MQSTRAGKFVLSGARLCKIRPPGLFTGIMNAVFAVGNTRCPGWMQSHPAHRNFIRARFRADGPHNPGSMSQQQLQYYVRDERNAFRLELA
jgi:hypothetical protein